MTHIQYKMLCVIFEGYVMNKYCSYDVPRSECKYIDCNVTDPLGYLTITLTIGFVFDITFSPHLNVGPYIYEL